MDKIPKEIKKIIENYIIFKPKTNKELKVAVDLWCENKENALKLYGHIYNWNTCLITNMDDLFSYKTNFNENINNWDVSNVKDMSYMFFNCIKFNKLLNKWDVSNVINMKNMFENCMEFNQSLNNWKINSVINFDYMFCNCKNYNKLIDKWDITFLSIKKFQMFLNCPKVEYYT